MYIMNAKEEIKNLIKVPSEIGEYLVVHEGFCVINIDDKFYYFRDGIKLQNAIKELPFIFKVKYYSLIKNINKQRKGE